MKPHSLYCRNIIKTLLYLLVSLPFIFTGHITPWDLEVDFLNQDLATSFKLYFTLENPLPVNQYARIVWPYDLGFPNTNTWQIAGEWGTVSGRCSDPDITLPIEIKRSQLTADATKYVYYIRFTSGTSNTFGSLLAQQPYLLSIKALLTPSASGTLGPIEFYTVSSGGSATDLDEITYDSNPVFNYLHITPTAPSSLAASFSSTSSIKNNIAANNYPVIMDITTSVAIPSAFRLVFETTTTEFSFVEGTCVNLASTTPSITKLASGFKASYTPHKVLISVNEELTAGRTLRFQCGIKNPNYMTTGGLKFKTMWLDAPHAVEQVTVALGLSTQPWNWGTTADPIANLRIYIGWGIDFTTDTDLPDCFKIYKSNVNHYIYNTVKFGFAPSQNTPTGEEIILTLKTMNSDNFVIIPSTLVENLSNAKGKKVSCSIQTLGAIKNTIKCTGVGPLSRTMQYFISFKFYIKSTATETELGNIFGELEVTDTNSLSVVAAGKSAIADKNIYTNTNTFWSTTTDPTDGNFRANNLVHSFRTADAVTTPSNTQYGMFAPATITDSMDLIFEQYWASSYVSTATPAIGDGVEYFTTPAIIPISNQVNSPAFCADNTGVKDFIICEASLVGNVVTSPGRYYTRLRFGPNTTVVSQFSSPNAATPRKLTMSNLRVSKPSGLFFMDDGVFDFYGRGIHSNMIVANLPNINLGTARSRFMVNSYVVSQGALSNVHLGVSMYWTATSDHLDGTKFPAYIRILGYMSTTERSGLQRLAVFFNGLDVYYEDDGTVPCAANVRSLTCYGKSGHNVNSFNPLVLNRVIIDVSPLKQGDSNVNRLQIIIPVKTVNNFVDIDMSIATLTHQSFFYSDKNYFKTTFLKTKARTSYTSLGPTLASYENNAYRIIPTSPINIGEITSKITFPNTIILGANQNPDSSSNPNIYGAMTYCAPWPWNSHNSFYISPIPSSVSNLYTCASLSYKDASGTRHYCSYCPVQGALTASSSAQTSKNFILPYSLGQAVPTAYMAFSGNNGVLRTYGLDERTTLMQVPSTLTGLRFIGNPSIFYSNYKNYQVSITFTSSVAIPKTGRIQLRPSGSDFGYVVIGSAIATFDGTTCTLSAFTSTLFSCALLSTKDFAAGSHNLTIKGIDFNSVGSDTPYGFHIEVYTASTGTSMIEKSISPGSFTVVTSAGYKLEVKDVLLDTTNYGAVSWLTFNFRPQKLTTFSNEQLVFDLGNDFKAAQGSRPLLCYLREGGSLSYKFKSCSISNLNTLTLQPNADYWRNDSANEGYITLYIANAIIPSSVISTSLNGNLQRSGTVVQALASPIVYPTVVVATAISSLSLSKMYNRDGSVLEVEFTYTPSVDLTNHHSIYIIFPPYYSPSLGYNNLYCTINNQPVYCMNNRGRTLRMRYFPTLYPAGTAHKLRIYGIVNPKFTTASSIFLALDNDEDTSTYVEQGTVTDVVPTGSALQSLMILYNLTVSTTEFRTSTDYTVIIKTNFAINSGNYLVIDFPDKYGNYLSVPEYYPTCSLEKTPIDSATYVSTCYTFGSRVKIPLQDTLAANSYFTLKLIGVRNPDEALCKMNKLVISVVDSSESTVVYRSISQYTNCKFLTYSTNPLLDTLQWTLDGATVKYGTAISLPRGVFSTQLCLKSSVDKFKETFNISLNPSEETNFTISPDPLMIGTGYDSVCLKLGSFQTTPTTFYDIKFAKTEALPANFTSIPRLKLHLKDVQIEITPTKTSYIVSTNGVSLPITFDLQKNPPATDLVIEATLSDPTSFTFLESSSVTITGDGPIGYFFIKAVGGAAEGTTGTLTFTLSGTDASSYTMTTNSVGLTIDNAVITDFKYTVEFSNLKQATFQEFVATANQNSIIYWGIILDNTYERPCDYIKDNALTFTEYNSLDYAQEQFGFVLLPSTELTKKFNVTNLRSKQNYNIKFCGESLSRTSAPSQTLTFASFDKNVKIVSATFTLSAALTTQQEIDFACFLASEFRLLEHNVISENGHACIDKYPAIPLPKVYITPPAVYSPAALDTSSYTYTSSRRLLIEEKFGFLQQCQRQLSSPVYVPQKGRRLDTSGTTTTTETKPTKITYIFYGNAQSESADVIDTRIQRKLLVLDPTARPKDFSFKSQLAIFQSNYAGGFPNITYGVYNGLINLITPAFATFPPIKVSMDVYWAVMSNVKLESSGYVYGVAVLAGESAPNVIQIRHGLNGYDHPAPSAQKIKAGDDETVLLNFTGLANYTAYDLYYYATNEDISRFALTSSIKKISIQTVAAPPADVFGVIMKMSWSLLALAMMVLHLV